MPQALAAVIIGAVQIIGGALGLSGAITAAIALGASLLVSSLFQQKQPKPSDGQQVVRQAVGSRKRHYGIVHTGGQLTFEDSRDGTLGMIVTLGTGLESGIIEHRINDKVVTLNGFGLVEGASYHNAIHIYTRPGDDNQTYISEFGAKFPDWTSDHRQRGCAHAAIMAGPVKSEQFSEVYNGQVPQYTQVRRGVRVYDPRLDSTAIIYDDGAGYVVYGTGAQRLDDRSTWAWSDNAALVIADYWGHEDGYGGGHANINWTRIAIEAAHSDEHVTTYSGDTIARWRLWASYSLNDEERRQVLANMLKACDGFCWQDAQGKFNLMVGRYEAPDITLTDDHILSLEASLGQDAPRQITSAKMLYTEVATGYREQESATISAAGLDEDPNAAPQSIELYYAPHHNQAARIGKLIVNQLGDDRWQILALLNLYGLNLIGRRFVALDSTAFGVAGIFKVDGLKLNLRPGQQTVEATLAQVDPADWDFDAATEEGTPPLDPTITTASVTIPVPTITSLSSVQIALASGNGVAIAVQLASLSRPDLTCAVQYRETGSGDDAWLDMTVNNDAGSAVSGLVNSGTGYDVRARCATITGRTGDWSATSTITPTATAIVPAPGGLSAIGSTGSATVRVNMPADAVAYVRVYHGTTSSFSGATQLGSDIVEAAGVMVELSDTGLAAGTEYYWARAFDGAGGVSTLIGPATATIS